MKRYLFLSTILLLTGIASHAQYTSYADSLADLIKRAPPDTDKTSLLNRLGWDNMYRNPDTSIILSNQAVEIAQNILSGKEVETNEGLKKAAQRELAQSFNCLGVFYWVVSDYSTSIKYHQQALALRRILGDRSNEGISLNNLGLVYKAQGNYNEALKNYFAAISLAIEFKDKSLIASDLVNLGIVFDEMGEHQRALNFYFTAIPIYKEEKDLEGLSMVYSYIGGSYKDLNDFTKSLEYFDKAIAISRQIQNIYLESFELNNTAEVYIEMKRLDKALEYLQISLPMAREVGELSLVSTVLGNLGDVYLEMNDYKTSEKYLTEALEIAENIEAYPNIELTAHNLSKLYAKTERFQLAYNTQSLYIAAHDSMYNDTKTKELGQLETKHELTLEAREKQLSEEERLRKIKAEKNRKDLLQISGIVLSLVIFGIGVMLLGFKKVSPRIANAITFFATLLLFEFLLVLFDPTVDNISNGEPAYKLLCNAVLALGIFPVHAIITRLLKSRLSKKQN